MSLAPFLRWILLLGLLASEATGLEVTHVSHTPEALVPSAGETVSVRFHLDGPASVKLQIYDARDLLVRSIAPPSLGVSAGDHQLAWDGRDDEGQLVPLEAYHYTIEAIGEDGSRTVWDATDFGGEKVVAKETHWDPAHSTVSYRIDESSRVRIRIGLANNGPLLRTLVNWSPRLRGEHREVWNGRDTAGVLELSGHPALEIDVTAFALPKNAIIVGDASETDPVFLPLPEDTPRRAQSRKPEQRHRMFGYSSHPAEQRGDFSATLTLPDGLDQTDEGIPIVSAPLPIEVSVPNEAFSRLINQRSEAVFYLDGKFVFERETGFLPITWTWDPGNHASGLHYLTVNFRGYEGHFGIGTIPVWIAEPL